MGRGTTRNYQSDRLTDVALLEAPHFIPHPRYFFVYFNLQHTEIFLENLLANARVYMRKKVKTTQSTDFSNAFSVTVYPPLIRNFIYQNLGLNLDNTLCISKVSPLLCTVTWLRVGQLRICPSIPGRQQNFSVFPNKQTDATVHPFSDAVLIAGAFS